MKLFVQVPFKHLVQSQQASRAITVYSVGEAIMLKERSSKYKYIK